MAVESARGIRELVPPQFFVTQTWPYEPVIRDVIQLPDGSTVRVGKLKKDGRDLLLIARFALNGEPLWVNYFDHNGEFRGVMFDAKQQRIIAVGNIPKTPTGGDGDGLLASFNLSGQLQRAMVVTRVFFHSWTSSPVRLLSLADGGLLVFYTHNNHYYTKTFSPEWFLLSARSWRDPSTHGGTALKVVSDASGNIIFPVTVTISGGADTFVFKQGADGQLLQVLQATQLLKPFVVRPNGGFVAIKQGSSSSSDDAYLLRYNADGSLRWHHGFAGLQSHSGYKALHIAPNGDIIVGTTLANPYLRFSDAGQLLAVASDSAANIADDLQQVLTLPNGAVGFFGKVDCDKPNASCNGNYQSYDHWFPSGSVNASCAFEPSSQNLVQANASVFALHDVTTTHNWTISDDSDVQMNLATLASSMLTLVLNVSVACAGNRDALVASTTTATPATTGLFATNRSIASATTASFAATPGATQATVDPGWIVLASLLSLVFGVGCAAGLALLLKHLRPASSPRSPAQSEADLRDVQANGDGHYEQTSAVLAP